MVVASEIFETGSPDSFLKVILCEFRVHSRRIASGSGSDILRGALSAQEKGGRVSARRVSVAAELLLRGQSFTLNSWDEHLK